MSTFDGRIEEIEDISVDCFTEPNYESSLFFLSHYHTDHMKGLRKFVPIVLCKPKIYLYSSEVTMTLLKHNYPEYANNFKCLPIGKPYPIAIPSKHILLSVTLLPAGHCPGSVMIFFESKKNILYTGDIRLNARDLHKYKPLFNERGQLKKIDKIYLDTTFFYKRWRKFPSREESLHAICEVIKNWTLKNKTVHINIITSAKYGSEYLFLGIFEKLNIPIHVSHEYYNVNQYFPNMDNAITVDESKTNIHNFCDRWGQFCNSSLTANVDIKCIKTSALIWTHWDKDQPIIQKDGKILKICVSCHSSYEETIEFLDFFKPKEISANVISDDISDKFELFKNINDCLKRYNFQDNLGFENIEQTSLENKKRKLN